MLVWNAADRLLQRWAVDPARPDSFGVRSGLVASTEVNRPFGRDAAPGPRGGRSSAIVGRPQVFWAQAALMKPSARRILALCRFAAGLWTWLTTPMGDSVRRGDAGGDANTNSCGSTMPSPLQQLLVHLKQVHSQRQKVTGELADECEDSQTTVATRGRRLMASETAPRLHLLLAVLRVLRLNLGTRAELLTRHLSPCRAGGNAIDRTGRGDKGNGDRGGPGDDAACQAVMAVGFRWLMIVSSVIFRMRLIDPNDVIE